MVQPARSPASLIPLLAFLVVVAGPLLALIWHAGNFLLQPDHLSLVILSERRIGLLFTSVVLATAVSLAGLVLGTLAGSLLWDCREGPWKYLRWSVLILAPVPAYIHALSWRELFSLTGLSAGGGPALVFSGWVQLCALLPFITAVSLLAFESVPGEAIEAGRLLQPDERVFFAILLPLAMPVLLAGAGIVFLLTLADYSVPSLFSVHVYALEIFAEFSAGNNPALAFLVSLPLLVIALAVVPVAYRGIVRAARVSGNAGPSRVLHPAYPGWFILLRTFAMAIFLIQAGVLLAGLIIGAGPAGEAAAGIAAAAPEIGATLLLSLAAGLACLPLAYAAVSGLEAGGATGTVWWAAILIPCAVPPALTGIGIIALWSMVPVPVYGTFLAPLFAMLARFAPLAALIAFGWSRTIDRALLEAGQVFGRRPGDFLLRIRIPLMATGLLMGACVVVALTAGELGATLVTVPPGMATVTLRAYNYLHYGATPVVAGLCCVLVLLMALAVCLAIALFRAGGSWFSGARPNGQDGCDAHN